MCWGQQQHVHSMWLWGLVAPEQNMLRLWLAADAGEGDLMGRGGINEVAADENGKSFIRK